MEVRDAASAVYRVEPEAARADDEVPPGYKRTEVGVIPADWSARILREGIKLKSGQHVLVRYCNTSGEGVPYITGPADFPDGKIQFTKFTTRPGMICDPDDILVTVKGSGSGTLVCSDRRYCISRQLMALSVDSWHQPYIYLSLVRNSMLFAAAATGLIPGLSRHDILNKAIPLPPTLAEQQAIAEALSDADALIESLQQLIAKQRAIKQGAMQALLTGRQRLPGFSDEWRTNQLGDLATFHKGKGLPKSALDDNGKFPCIHYGELFTRLPETVRETCSRTNWTGDTFRSFINDVLMPTSDVTPSGLAKASCVARDGIIIGGDVLVIRTDSRIICGTFLSYVIRNSESQILQLVTGTTVFHLYASDMRKFEFRVPPIAEQEAIITILSDMDAEIEALEACLAKTRALKAGMMQQLLTGRIRLV